MTETLSYLFFGFLYLVILDILYTYDFPHLYQVAQKKFLKTISQKLKTEKILKNIPLNENLGKKLKKIYYIIKNNLKKSLVLGFFCFLNKNDNFKKIFSRKFSHFYSFHKKFFKKISLLKFLQPFHDKKIFKKPTSHFSKNFWKNLKIPLFFFQFFTIIAKS